MFQGHPTSLLTESSTVGFKSKSPARDLEVVRMGELHTFVSYALLPEPSLDALMTELSGGPKRVGDLAAFQQDRRKLLRTLAWLGKFDLVEFQ
jgi:hypothetical protein